MMLVLPMASKTLLDAFVMELGRYNSSGGWHGLDPVYILSGYTRPYFILDHKLSDASVPEQVMLLASWCTIMVLAMHPTLSGLVHLGWVPNHKYNPVDTPAIILLCHEGFIAPLLYNLPKWPFQICIPQRSNVPIAISKYHWLGWQ